MTKLRGLILLLVAGLLLAGAPIVASEGEEDDDDISTEILLQLAPGVEIFTIEQRYNVTLIESLPELRTWKVRVAPGADILAIIDLMDSDPDVIDAERHHELDIPEGVQRSIPDLGLSVSLDDYFNQPATTAIRLGPARTRYAGFGVTVAVLDTGISFAHPEVAGMRMLAGHDFVDGDLTTDPHGDGLDNDGDGLVDEALHHGTYVTGLLRLVAPGIRVLPVRVLDADGLGTAFGLARGILFASRSGADIINLSLGVTDDSSIVERAIDEALARGVIVVAASGNSGDEQVLFPASESDVIAVAAVDGALRRAAFSSFGSKVDLSAPGQDLLSTFGNGDFAGWEGTSFATPLVSGGIALLLDRYPGLSLEQVRILLDQTVQPFSGELVDEDKMGSGVLDLDAVTRALSSDVSSLEVRVEGDTSVIEWSPVLGQTHYDIVRGDVRTLSMESGENPVTVLGAIECLANNLQVAQSASLSDPTLPAEGQAFFYVFRGSDGTDYGLPDGPSRTAGSADCPTE